MPVFRYSAATTGNEARNGTIETETVQDALKALHEQGLCVIRIGRPSHLNSTWEILNREITLRKPVRAGELARLSQEWAALVEAGISIEESLALLCSTSRSGTRPILLAVRDVVKAGVPLHQALGRFPNAFPTVYRALIQAGESAGKLAPTLRRLADDLTARRTLAEEIRNALLYPAFLMVTATVGVMTLLLVVVPNLETLLGDGQTERLPVMTKVVIGVSHILREYGLTAIGILAGLALPALVWGLTPNGRLRRDAAVLKLPIWGRLVRTIETGRFARALGGLLGGGVSVSVAMRISLDTIANRQMSHRLEAAHQAVTSGAPIGDAIAAGSVFAEDAVGLIRVGERTGRLSESLERAAAMLEARASRELKALTAIITPVMTISFGAIAGLIVYAMLSTILSINELAIR